MRFASILAVLCPFLGSACASPPAAPAPRSGVQESVERLAVTLIDLAERRVDLNTVRAAVLPFHGEVAGRTKAAPPGAAEPSTVQPTAAGASSGAVPDLPALELEREFELALANRLNLVEMSSEEVEARLAAVGPPPPDASHVASHALLGDYTARDGKLILSVRLVDLESRLVLSAARDAIPLSWLSSGAQAQLAPPTPAKRSVAIAAASLAAHSAEQGAAVPHSAPVASAVTQAATESTTTAPPPRPTPTSGPVEDFETWRARHSGEPLPEIPPLENPAPAQQTPGAGPAQPPDVVMPAPTLQDVASFPWRRDGRLSALLRIPRSSRQ